MRLSSPVRLWRQLFEYAGFTAFAQFATGVVYILAAHACSPADFGRAAIVLSASTVVAVLYDGGLQSYLVRECARGSLSMAKLRRVNYKKRLLLIVPVAVVAIFSARFLESLVGAVLAACCLYVMVETRMLNGELRIRQQFRLAGLTQVLGRFAGLVAAALTYYYGGGQAVLLVGVGIGMLGEAVADRIFLALPKFRVEATGRERFSLFQMQRAALSFWLTGIAVSAQQLDTVVVALAAGPEIAGVYSVASRLVGPLVLLATSLNSIASARLAKAAGHGEYATEEKRVFKAALVMGVIPIVSAAALSPLLVNSLLPIEYSKASLAVIVLSIGAACATASQGAVVALQVRRSERYVAVVLSLSVALGLAAIPLLVRDFGVVGAAGGFVLCHGLVVAFLWSRVMRLRRNDVELENRVAEAQ